MKRNTSPYQICTALAVLVGGVFLVLAHGTFGHISGCPQNRSAGVEATLGGELETEFPVLSLGSASSTARLSASPAVSGSIPECGPDGPAHNLGSSPVRSVRLTERDDWGAQSTSSSVFGRTESLSRFAEDQRIGSSPFRSRAQGSLGTVRSVVLRL